MGIPFEGENGPIEKADLENTREKILNCFGVDHNHAFFFFKIVLQNIFFFQRTFHKAVIEEKIP